MDKNLGIPYNIKTQKPLKLKKLTGTNQIHSLLINITFTELQRTRHFSGTYYAQLEIKHIETE